jgi:predicted Fe-S protein YdhL (DUF1289 family)
MTHTHADHCTYTEMLDRFNSEIVRYAKLHDFEQSNVASENLRAFIRKYKAMKNHETIAQFETRMEVAS